MPRPGVDRLADFHILKDIGLPEIGNLNRIVWYALIDGVALVSGSSAWRPCGVARTSTDTRTSPGSCA